MVKIDFLNVFAFPMHTMLQGLTQHLDIMRHVYVFDGTYREKFTDSVLVDIWRAAWNTYLDKLAPNPAAAAVVGHLFEVWGVSERNLATYQPDLTFTRRFYLPDRFNVFTHDQGDGTTRAMAFMQLDGQTVSVFNGEVVTPAREMALQEGAYRTRRDAVYEDRSTGWVVYV